jgi:flagellin
VQDAGGELFTAATTLAGEAGTGSLAAGSVFTGRVTLASENGSAVQVDGSAASIAKVGLAKQGGSGEVVGGGLSILSASGAKVALQAIDKAIDKVSASRGDLGAVQNRLETRVNVLTSSSTNVTEARSRIEDTDFSSETTQLAKAQILTQAATAMLAQANQSQQGVLSLLR